ncbi:MAG TPA: carbamoyltransferase [Candidatus Methanoperedens sp.]|nr:carbamoyltransferase [Candidatus Methanoperedens sp.]
MTAILGISAFYHDSAAALLVDGKIVAAAQEERFTRVKHDASFPRNAIGYCLEEAGIGIEGIDYAGYYEKPILKLERLLESYLAYAPRGFSSFRRAVPQWVSGKANIRRELSRGLGARVRNAFVFSEHHESHAASAFFPSPFERAAIMTFDGVGEWATASFGTGVGNRVELTHEMRFPHSLGLLYSAFTYFCGFKVNDGEYKLMGLAPYGRPRYVAAILGEMVELKPDGSLYLNMEYFDYVHGLKMTSSRFDRLFGGGPRSPDAPLTDREMDLAASVQAVAEEAILRAARHVRRETGMTRLCLGGGVALNCVANGKLLRERVFEDIWIQPASGDAGGALGVALLIWHQLLGNPRGPHPPDGQAGSLLGPSVGGPGIRHFLDGKGASYESMESDEALFERVAGLLAGGMVVGWVQGRMEFGPRALGARSILADPRSPSVRERINRDIKRRESFRPFAASVLQDRAAEYFDVPEGYRSPYMLLVSEIAPGKRIDPGARDRRTRLEELQVVRSEVPAVTHVDHSCRIQTVDAGTNPRFAGLIEAFRAKTGCALLLNTSLNVRDEPIACTVEDAWNCFAFGGLDALAVDRFVVTRKTGV